MRITCPSCTAEYDVPGALAPGRTVRCARCSEQWAPVPAPPLPLVIEAVAEPAPPAPPPPPMAAFDAKPPVPLVSPVQRRAPARWPLPLAWAGSVAVLVALVAAAFVWREPVMQAWPASVRVYGSLGLTAHP